MHVRAIFDDKGRIMVIATHNCDNGDSWEREGEDEFFFHEFSEKRGYPLGINIMFYLMTHEKTHWLVLLLACLPLAVGRRTEGGQHRTPGNSHRLKLAAGVSVSA